jgi:1-acyl-sn-glycerol-3-phosphate acyltransferase
MAELTPAYRGVMLASTPVVRWWGRMSVEGLEHLPAAGPVLLCANHDSYWDPLAIGIAAQPRRMVHALAKSQLWKYRPVGVVLDGMGQIPILRGQGDTNALQRAIEALRDGRCIGVFLEGTRSRGRTLRARGGFGRLAEAVPEAEIVCATVVGTSDIAAFPRTRPDIHIRFFRPQGGGLQPGESPGELGARLLAEIRAAAPVPGAPAPFPAAAAG